MPIVYGPYNILLGFININDQEYQILHFGKHFLWLCIHWTRFLLHVYIEVSSVHSDPLGSSFAPACKVFLYIKRYKLLLFSLMLKYIWVWIMEEQGKRRWSTMEHVFLIIHNIWYVLWIFYCHLSLLPLVLNYWFPFMSR